MAVGAFGGGFHGCQTSRPAISAITTTPPAASAHLGRTRHRLCAGGGGCAGGQPGIGAVESYDMKATLLSHRRPPGTLCRRTPLYIKLHSMRAMIAHAK